MSLSKVMEDLSQTVRPNAQTGWMIFLVIGGIGLVVYWFFIRPGMIKGECYKYAYSTPNLGNTQEWVKATNYYYEACLHRKGL